MKLIKKEDNKTKCKVEESNDKKENEKKIEKVKMEDKGIDEGNDDLNQLNFENNEIIEINKEKIQSNEMIKVKDEIENELEKMNGEHNA